MIFKKAFKAPKEDDIYKSSMKNKLHDPTLKDFAPVSMMGVNKCDKRYAKKEWVDSYKEAAKRLSIITQEHATGQKKVTQNNETNPFPAGTIYVFYSYQLTLPTIFLARHAAELALKEAIELAGGGDKNATHNLNSLWCSLLSHFPKGRIPFDRATIKQIHSYLEILMHLDDDGTKVRYATDKNNNYTHGDFEWVNCVALTESLDAFIDSLRSIDYEYVQLSNPKKTAALSTGQNGAKATV